ncbi:hypothetical protein EMPS_02372 [Entomortierella parvispora]|uniref:Uncharacterized protein n=1 Tax=Entomortierella parvispora TaxID=205924 RepID=A0A9P3H4P8_9FUNG|nr:hypothetical protein EMPS_02372 [Entomortierella parvispora]
MSGRSQRGAELEIGPRFHSAFHQHSINIPSRSLVVAFGFTGQVSGLSSCMMHRLDQPSSNSTFVDATHDAF